MTAPPTSTNRTPSTDNHFGLVALGQCPLQHAPCGSPVDPLLLQANVLSPALLLEIPIELLLLLHQKRQFRCRMLRRFIHPQRLVLQQGVFVHEHGLQRWNL